jgi:small subunit ribosomal protein S1
VEETLPFKVIEFSRDGRRIILSHSKVHEDEQRKEREKDKENVSPADTKSTKASGKKERATEESGSLSNLAPMEKTTLGDIGQLAALKDRLLGQENDVIGSKKDAGKKKAETEKPAEEVESKAKDVEVETETNTVSGSEDVDSPKESAEA